MRCSEIGYAVAALLAAALLTGAAPARRDPSDPLVSTPSGAVTGGPMDIYLLMGQSNMSGRGDAAELTRAERVPDPAIRLYANDGAWRAALEPLDDATDQIDRVSADSGIAAVGPGLFFARALPRARRPRIGLVPCAKGGSKIGAWTPGYGRDTLYGSCLARAREASSRGRIAGILWYQGESDTGEQNPAQLWPGEFSAMVTAIRRDLAMPGLPVVFVGLADPPPGGKAERANWAELQSAQASLRLACARTVSAAGLPLKADGLHLTTDGQRRLGPALARAMIQLRSDPRCH